MRETERGLRRRRDAGQDPSGTHRDIARDVSPPPEMLYGTRTSSDKPWRFVLGCLSAPRGGGDSSPTLKMLDTALLMESTGGGHAEGYFFTAADGRIHRKAERFLSLKMVERELLVSSANSHPKKGKPRGDGTAEHEEDDRDRVVAMARTRNGEFLPVTSKALHTAVKAGTMPAEYECLQPFAQAKDYDTTAEFANYQHQYTLDDTGGGVSIGTVHRRVAAGLSGREVVAVPPPGGRRRRTLILSRNARLNAEIDAAVRSVVLAVERSKRCRVLCLETEFVLDDQDGLWLAGVTACKMAARPATALLPAPPPTRQEKIAAHDRAPIAGTINEDAGVEGGNALATEVRSRKREAEEATSVVSDTEFSQLLRAVGYRSPMKKRSGVGSDGSRRRHGRSNPRSYGRGAKHVRAPDSDPSRASSGGLTHPSQAQLSGGHRPKMATDHSSVDSAASGTSFDWAVEDESVQGPAARNPPGVDLNDGGASGKPPSPITSLSTEGFESSATSLDQATTSRIHGTSQLEGCRGDFCEFDVGKRVRDEESHKRFIEMAARAAGAANGLVTNLSPLLQKILMVDVDNAGDGSLSAGGGARSGGTKSQALLGLGGPPSEWCDIPFRSVVQARHERTLVKIFLDRHARGKDGAYVRGGEGGADGHRLVGGKYPGVYYRPVKVCLNCYMVYTLIDGARARALRKDRRKDRCRQHPIARKANSDRSPPRDLRGGKGVAAADAPLAARGGGDNNQASHTCPSSDEGSATAVTDAGPPLQRSDGDNHEHSPQALSLAEARRAMDAVSQGDVSELRSFGHPPAAVGHVVSVVLSLLEGEIHEDKTAAASWAHARVVMGRSEFMTRLQTLDPRTVMPRLIEVMQPVLDSPSFDPAVVRPLSNAAGNLCLWALGVIQANRWLTGSGHPRSNVVPARDNVRGWGDARQNKSLCPASGIGTAWLREPPFPQKKRVQMKGATTPRRHRRTSPFRVRAGRKRCRAETTRAHGATTANDSSIEGPVRPNQAAEKNAQHASEMINLEHVPPTDIAVGPATSPTVGGRSVVGFGNSHDAGAAKVTGTAAATSDGGGDTKERGRHKRNAGRALAQARASGRLAYPCQTAGGAQGAASSGRDFVSSDGKTRLPYRVCGEPVAATEAVATCNFVVVHDFFDNVETTEVLFKPVTRKHRGCLVLAFSYPGQAGTALRAPSSASDLAPGSDAVPAGGEGREEICSTRSGSLGKGIPREEVPNNAFIAPRLHELLQHVHSTGEMSLAAPFHLVGIGNGVAIAAAFALRYGDHPLYRSSLRSIVSINGFSSVDSQLAAVLHSSLKAFATLPPTRPDLPISFMSRYVFGEDYLKKVGQNLALSIYTAVANPISLEGRQLVCNSALLHEDLSKEVGTFGVPIVLLQSTEDILVNPANVDPFLRGRSSTRHFWSHEFRDMGGGGSAPGGGTNEGSGATGAGGGGDSVRTSSGPGSVYGRKGLTDLLRALSSPRGTFVAWVRAGHEVRQEAKRAVVDLLDALAKPTPEYAGVEEAEVLEGAAGTIGLHPSRSFVARVNRRSSRGGGEIDYQNAGATRSETNHLENYQAERKSGADEVNMACESGQGITPQNGTQGRNANIVATSPFPSDISIPRLPARIVQRAPNTTSPIKRSQVAEFSASAAASGRYTDPATARRRFSPSADDSFPSAKDKRTGRDSDRREGRRGRVTEDESPRAFGLSAGGRRRPKKVWQEHTPESCFGSPGKSVCFLPVARKPEAGVSARNERRRECGQSRPNSCSSSPSDLRDAAPTPSIELIHDGVGFNEASRRPPALVTTVLTPEQNGDPWGLVNPAPSLELATSDSLQRDKRRWAGTNRGGADASNSGSYGAAARDEPNGDSPPGPASTATVAAAAMSGANPALNGGAVLGGFLEAEARLEDRLCEVRRRAVERLKEEQAAAERRIAGISEQQEARSIAFAEEDRVMIADLEVQLAASRLARAPADLQRAVDGADVDDEILRAGLASPPLPLRARTHSSSSSGRKGAADICAAPSRAMPPLNYSLVDEIPDEFRRAGDVFSIMEDAARDEEKMIQMREAAGSGGPATSLEQFQRDQALSASDAAANRLATKRAYRERSVSDLKRAKLEAALRLQALARGARGRERAAGLAATRREVIKQTAAATGIQKAARGRLARKGASLVRERTMAEVVLGRSAIRLQCAGRGMLGRRVAASRRRQAAALFLQRSYRGHLGRRSAARQRSLLEEVRARDRAGVRIQSWWRCRRAMDEYGRVRVHSIAAVEIQRVYRGAIGRRVAGRRLEWQRAGPGQARLKLGMRLIEDTKESV